MLDWLFGPVPHGTQLDLHVRDYRSRLRAHRLLASEPVLIDLDRVQLEERRERREALDRELSTADTRACFERIRRRMQLGDNVWVPPLYNAEPSYREWRRRHRRRRIDNVSQIDERKKA